MEKFKQKIFFPDKWIVTRERKTKNLVFKPCIKKVKINKQKSKEV